MSLPRFQQRTLDRIGHSLTAEDRGFGMRFAFFAMLTRHEPMPETEQVQGRRQRSPRRAVILPLAVISVLGLLAAGWLTNSGHACPARAIPAAHGMSEATWATRCPPSSASKQKHASHALTGFTSHNSRRHIAG
jgi:hypothetical protein